MSVNFSYSFIFKSISLSYTLNGSFTHMWFSDVVIGHLKNISALNYSDLSTTKHLVIYIKKSHSLISPLISCRNSLSIEKLPSSHWQIQFSKILIFTWQLEFFIEVTGSLHFREMSTKYPSMKKIIVFILFFQYNIKLGISWKSHLQWLVAQTIAQVLFPPGSLFFSFRLSHVACGILSPPTRGWTWTPCIGSRFAPGPSGRFFQGNVWLQYTVQVLYTYFPVCLTEHFTKYFAKWIIFSF